MAVLDEDLDKELPGKGMTDATVYIDRFNRLKTARAVWQSHWQEVKELVRPNTADFNRMPVPGEKKTLKIFDATAVLDCEELASGLQSYLVSPSEQWFQLTLNDPNAETIIANDLEVQQWLDTVSSLIYSQYSRPAVNFNSTMSEVFTDLAGFGTACMYQEWNYGLRQLSFKSFALSEIFIDEDAAGNVCLVYRFIYWTAEQAWEIFGDELPADLLRMRTQAPDQKFEFLHCVQPRKGYDPMAGDSTAMKFISAWVYVAKKVTLRESGYHSMPYVTPRWTKTPGEVYGRSPAMNSLPDIKMLNALMKVLIVASEKVIDPTMAAPDDSFLGPLRSVPGAIWWYDASITNMQERVFPIETKADLPAGREQMQDLRTSIDRAFHVDYLRAEQKKERQSQMEIADQRDEMLRQLAPLLGRQESELLGKTIGRTYAILHAAGIIPPAPRQLQKKELFVNYVSPASRAQSGSKANEFSKFMQDVVPLAQVDPTVLDAIDMDEAFRQIARARDISAKVMRTPKAIAAMRANRAKQQQQQQGVETAQGLATAYQKVAQGRQALAAGGSGSDLGGT